jgi:hypothetical protein
MAGGSTAAKCDNHPMDRLSGAGERPQVPAWSLALDAVIAAAATALAIGETISRAHGDSFAVPRTTAVLPQPAWYPSVWLLERRSSSGVGFRCVTG